MCRASRRLISSTSAASVVVLPEPVGPPIRTSPRGRWVRSSTVGGSPSDASRGTRAGSARSAARGGPTALAVQVDPEASQALHAERPVRDLRLAVDAPRVRRQRRQHRLFDVDAVERTFSQRADPAVHPDRRGGAGHQQEIAAPGIRQQPQPGLDPARVADGGTARGRRGRVQLGDQPVDVLGIALHAAHPTPTNWTPAPSKAYI
jgi:hypothetical protein